MPLYEYQCKKCHHRFERIVKFSDKPIKKCPDCGGQVEQMISAPAVQFKGSGWYVTDYAKKGSTAASSSSDGETAAKDTSKDSAKETKKDDKPKTEKTEKKKADKK